MKSWIFAFAAIACISTAASARDIDCKLNRSAEGKSAGGSRVAQALATAQIKGSCETRRICIAEVTCKDDSGKDFNTFAVCQATEMGCPALQDCLKDQHVELQGAGMDPVRRTSPVGTLSTDPEPTAGSAKGL